MVGRHPERRLVQVHVAAGGPGQRDQAALLGMRGGLRSAPSRAAASPGRCCQRRKAQVVRWVNGSSGLVSSMIGRNGIRTEKSRPSPDSVERQHLVLAGQRPGHLQLRVLHLGGTRPVSTSASAVGSTPVSRHGSTILRSTKAPSAPGPGWIQLVRRSTHPAASPGCRAAGHGACRAGAAGPTAAAR